MQPQGSPANGQPAPTDRAVLSFRVMSARPRFRAEFTAGKGGRNAVLAADTLKSPAMKTYPCPYLPATEAQAALLPPLIDRLLTPGKSPFDVPQLPLITADATEFVALKTGSESPAGEHVPRLPPKEPAARIWGEPTVRAASANAGMAEAMSPFSICAYGTAAPMMTRSLLIDT
jgi:hypothetical protein